MHRDDEAILVILTFLILPSLYLLLILLPVLIFYVLPLLASALLLGKFWSFGCHYGFANHRRVAGFMAATAIVLLLTIGFPHPMTVSADGEVTIEAPRLYRGYNALKGDIEGLINWSWLRYFRPLLPSLIPPKVYQPVLYDLRDLAWMFWLGAFIGAPVVFLRQGHKEDLEHIRSITEDFKQKMDEANRKNLSLEREYWSQQKWSDETIAARDEEIAKLKVVAAQIQGAAGPPAPNLGSGAPSPEKPGGVFSSEAL